VDVYTVDSLFHKICGKPVEICNFGAQKRLFLWKNFFAIINSGPYIGVFALPGAGFPIRANLFIINKEAEYGMLMIFF